MVSADSRGGVCWVLRGDALIWEDLPQGHALFDARSGETHFVSDLPFLVLSVLDHTPRTLDEIAHLLSAPDTLDPSSLEKIRSALVYLAQAEIVESTEYPQREAT